MIQNTVRNFFGFFLSLNNLEKKTLFKVVVGSSQGHIDIYHLDKFLVKTIQTHHNEAIIRAKPILNNQFATVSDNGSFTIWNTTDWSASIVFNNDGRIYDIEYLGNYELAMADLRSIQFISMHTKKLSKKFILNSQILCLKLLPNGHLASGDTDNQIKIWNYKNSSKPVVTMNGHQHFILDLELICEHRLASASNDATVVIWDLLAFKKIFTLKGHLRGVSILRYMPAHYLLASGSLDGSISVWNVTNGEHRYKLLHGDNKTGSIFWSLDYMKDEKVLVSGSKNGIIKYWNFQSTIPFMMQAIETKYEILALSVLKRGNKCLKISY